MKITKTYLVKLDACPEQVARFAAEWPRGATVNETNIRRAMETGLDCIWLIERIEGPAWAEYQRIKGPAWAEYQRIKGQAWAEYQRIKGQAIIAALMTLAD